MRQKMTKDTRAIVEIIVIGGNAQLYINNRPVTKASPWAFAKSPGVFYKQVMQTWATPAEKIVTALIGAPPAAPQETELPSGKTWLEKYNSNKARLATEESGGKPNGRLCVRVLTTQGGYTCSTHAQDWPLGTSAIVCNKWVSLRSTEKPTDIITSAIAPDPEEIDG